MSLDQNINNELKDAMLSKNEIKLRTIKAIKAAFLIAKTEKGATGEITAEQEIKILQNYSINGKNRSIFSPRKIVRNLPSAKKKKWMLLPLICQNK
jgi:uncharacterized protein YqeY